MKALSLRQPWATLVAIGAKRIETRSWGTNYRGPLAIHASKEFPKAARLKATTPPFYEAYRLHGMRNLWPHHLGHPLGCIVATVELAYVFQIETHQIPQRWTHQVQRECAFGDFSPGRYLWILKSVRPLASPIPAKGSLRLWEWDQSWEDQEG